MAQTQRANVRRASDTPRKAAPTVAPLPPEEQKKTGVRVRALRILLQEADGNIPALALAVGLGTQRVRDALEGVLPLGPEMAAHIEHSCHLPGAWLDHPDSPLTDKAKARIARALNGEDLDDEDDGYEEQASVAAPAAPVVVAEAAVQQAVTPAIAVEEQGLRVVKQTPVITVRKRRTSHAEVLAPIAPPELVPVPIQPTAPSATDAVTSTADTQQPARRGRKAGVKSVASTTEDNRRAWLTHVTTPKGTKSQLCRLLQAPDSFVAHLLSGRRTFTDKITEKIELSMGLEPGTIDGWTPGAATPAPEMPSSPIPVSTTADSIAKAVETMAELIKPAAPVKAEAPAAAPVVAAAPAPEAVRAPAPAKKAAPKASTPTSTATPAPEKVVSAPVAATPAPAPAPVSAPTPAPAPTPVKAVEAPANGTLDAALQSALTSLLNRVITEGKLNNQGAVRLLQELALLLD